MDFLSHISYRISHIGRLEAFEHMTSKKKIALYWCSSCGGCEESVLDLAEDILMVSEKADIVFWPIAFDFK